MRSSQSSVISARSRRLKAAKSRSRLRRALLSMRQRQDRDIVVELAGDELLQCAFEALDDIDRTAGAAELLAQPLLAEASIGARCLGDPVGDDHQLLTGRDQGL